MRTKHGMILEQLIKLQEEVRDLEKAVDFLYRGETALEEDPNKADCTMDLSLNSFLNEECPMRIDEIRGRVREAAMNLRSLDQLPEEKPDKVFTTKQMCP